MLPIKNIDGFSFDQLIQNILDSQPEVIGFSMIQWNAKLNLKISQEIKKRKPETLIVFVGPHLDHRCNQQWFFENPSVDLICNPEAYGEDFMTALLDQIAEDKLDYEKLPTAIFPSTDRKSWQRSAVSTDKRKFVWPDNLTTNSLDHLKDLSEQAKKQRIFFFSLGNPYEPVLMDVSIANGVAALILK